MRWSQNSLLLVFLAVTFCGFCQTEKEIGQNDISPIAQSEKKQIPQDTSFVRLADYSSDFVYDLKYATPDNFLKAAVYDCAQCYLRLKTVNALIKANETFIKLGYRIKIFDCYRPLDIQQKMWAILPDNRYVANPKAGSIHNRGGALDITLVDSIGNQLDMGTSFDFFGPESAFAYKGMSKSVKKNRQLLNRVMKKNGFRAIPSEWWHYNLKGSEDFPVANFKWDCP